MVWLTDIHQNRNKAGCFLITEDVCEFIAVVPEGWEYEQDEGEVIIIADDAEMQVRDRYDYELFKSGAPVCSSTFVQRCSFVQGCAFAQRWAPCMLFHLCAKA